MSSKIFFVAESCFKKICFYIFFLNFKIYLLPVNFVLIFLFQYKVWIKDTSEQNFLYANHIMKSDLARITEGCPKYSGVVVYSLKDVPLVSTGVTKEG